MKTKDKFWSKEDTEFLKKNYGKISVKEISKKVKRENGTIVQKALALNLKGYKEKRVKWTEYQIDFLLKNYSTIGAKEVSKILDIPYNSIIYKAVDLNLKFNKPFTWDKYFDNVLIEFYPSGNWNKIFELLPNENLTKDKIYKRARKLELTSNRYWSEKDIKIFKSVYPNHTNKYISENIFTDKNEFDIREMGAKLKIKKSKEKMNKVFLAEDMLISLKELGEKLGRTPLYYELINNGLASQKTYERRFGGYRKACELVGLVSNYSFFGKPNSLSSKNGDLCYSHSEVFITNFFIENNIPYIKEEKYSNHFYHNELNEKRCDWYIPNKKLFVEFFGFIGNKEYDIKLINKLRILKEIKVNLLPIYPKELSEEFLIKTFL